MRLEKLISSLLFLGLFLGLLFIYFAQERLFVSMNGGSGTLGSEKYLRILSVIAIFGTVALSIFNSKTKYHFSVYFSYVVLLVSIFLNFVISGGNITNMTQFMDTRGIGPWICFGLIFVSYDDKRYQFFKKFVFISVVFITLLSFYNFFDYGVGLWRGQALSKYRVYAVNLVWISPYVFLILKHNRKLQWLRFSSLIMGIILALVIQTRSFLIIFLVTIIFDFYHTRNKTSYMLLFICGLMGLAYLVLNTEIFYTSLQLLINRGTQDTRSLQLEAFVSQLNFFELITGKGYFASYRFLYGQWDAVDNQWLYLLWWGGLIPVITYFYLCVVIPIKVLIRGGLTYETKVECFTLILWALALTGLAIYTTITIDLFFFIVSIIQGRIIYKYSNSKKNG